MAHFILLHGFNDRSAGRDNIDRVAPFLKRKGHTVDCDGEDYGYFGLFRVRFARHAPVARIVIAIREALLKEQDVVVVGYSNGCNFGLQALGYIAESVRFVAVHPALPTKFTLPDCVTQCWVCYTRSDWAVRAASWVGWLIPGWGRAGAVGYRGKDPRIVSVDYSNVAAGHGGLWKEPSLSMFASDLHKVTL